MRELAGEVAHLRAYQPLAHPERSRYEHRLPVQAQAASEFKCPFDIACEIITHFKGRDLQDVGVALHGAMEKAEFDKMIKTIRPQMFQRKILARI